MKMAAPLSEPKPGLPRALDIGAALAALILLAPLVVICAIAVALSSRGPVIYRQGRIGRYGRPFTLYKFRSMRVSYDGPQITADGDGRITAIGAWLRKTKLDELPELVNILLGDMAFVGPRPEVPRYVDLSDHRWMMVLRAKPGLTDPVTVQLRNEQALLARMSGNREDFYVKTLLPYKIAGYLAYLNRRSWRTDLKVVWDTVIAVFLPGTVPAPDLNDLGAMHKS